MAKASNARRSPDRAPVLHPATLTFPPCLHLSTPATMMKVFRLLLPIILSGPATLLQVFILQMCLPFFQRGFRQHVVRRHGGPAPRPLTSTQYIVLTAYGLLTPLASHTLSSPTSVPCLTTRRPHETSKKPIACGPRCSRLGPDLSSLHHG